MTQQPSLFLSRVVSCPLCPYASGCGAKADIGPCEPVSADCCTHTITCQRCSQQGTESWNLLVGGAQHAKTYGSQSLFSARETA